MCFFFQNEIRIVLVGRTGSGISASGNSILQHVCFHSDSSGSSVTKTCCIGTTERDGKTVKVVDTPGLFGNIMTVDEIKREIFNCLALISPGPHVIVYVLRIGRFTNEEIQGVEKFLHIFGGNPLQYTIILFTGVDDLECDQVSNEEYLNNAPIYLQELVEGCSKRCVFLNNRLLNSKDSEHQAEDIFKLVKEMLKKNYLKKQPYYKNNIISQIAEDERTCVGNKHDKAICIPPYFKQIAGGSIVLATGMACFGIGPTLLPIVGAGVVGMVGVSKYYNGLSKPNDERKIGLEEIKEDSSIQCTIS